MPAKNRQSLRAFSIVSGRNQRNVSATIAPPFRMSRCRPEAQCLCYAVHSQHASYRSARHSSSLRSDVCEDLADALSRPKVLMAAAFLCYAEALAAFALHAAEIAGGAPAFFNAFYGSPSVMTPYAMAGYAGQCLAVFALMLIVNWRAMVGYFSDEPQTKAAKSSDTEKKAAPAENSDIGKK